MGMNSTFRRTRGVLAVTFALGVVASAHADWPQLVPGTGNGPDMGTTIATDSKGNVVIGGYAQSSAGNRDILVAKYSKTGVLQWSATWDGSAHGADQLVKLAVDSKDNIVVAGSTANADESLDAVVLSYSKTGSLNWSHIYDGGLHFNDRAVDLKIDSSDRPVLLASSNTGQFVESFFTLKFGNNGQPLWSQRLTGEAGNQAAPRSLAIDSEDNILVCGIAYTVAHDFDAVTVKYDRHGHQKWTRSYDTNGQFDDANFVSIDAAQNVYVSGATTESGIYKMIVLKYGPAGNKLWQKKFGSSGKDQYPSAMTVNDAGETFLVSASSVVNEYSDFVTTKLDGNGDKVWSQRTTSLPHNTSRDYCNNIRLDSVGNVVIGGTFDDVNGTSARIVVLKFDPSGNQIFRRTYSYAGSGGTVAGAMTVDASDNVYVTGFSYIPATQIYRAVILKY